MEKYENKYTGDKAKGSNVQMYKIVEKMKYIV